MLLGEIIDRFGNGTAALDVLSSLGDPGLLAAAEQAAAADGVPLDSWTRMAVGRFAAYADDEQWLGLLTACSNTTDPGSAALFYMLKTALKSASVSGDSA